MDTVPAEPLSEARSGGTIAGVRKAATALASRTADLGQQAAQLILDALPPAPDARAIDTTIIKRRAKQFRSESVKRVARGVRAALRKPTKRQLDKKLRAQIKTTNPAKRVRLRALDVARSKVKASPSPRQVAVTRVIDAEARYAAAHVRAQVARADGAARQALLEAQSPTGVVWRTAQDDRVTPDCAVLDGKAIPHTVARVYRPPLHAGCRCHLDPATGDVLSHADAIAPLDHATSLAEDAADARALLWLREAESSPVR